MSTGATTYTEGGQITIGRIRFGRIIHGMVEVYIHGSKSSYRPRHVWITLDLASRLKKYAVYHGIKRTEPLFPWDKYTGREYWLRVIQRLLDEDHLEFEGVVTYSLRHTFAVHTVRGDPEHGQPGADLLTLMKLMGHNRLETTQIYARHRADDAARALAVGARVMGLGS